MQRNEEERSDYALLSVDTAKMDSVIEDKQLEELLDAVDERTRIQQMLHNHIGDGFMSLARERYREPSSAERLGRLVYDDRDEVRSKVHLAVEMKGDQDIVTMAREFEDDSSEPRESKATLRKRKGSEESCEKKKGKHRVVRHADVRNSFMPVPSREVRDAIRCFRLAVDQAIELVNTNNKLQAALHARDET